MSLIERIKEHFRQTDIFLLLFLVFFTMDMVILKPVCLVAALVFLRGRIKWADFKASPLFYIFLPALAVVTLVLDGDFSGPRLVSFGVGCGFWLMALLAFVVIKVRIRDADYLRVEKALTGFFWINFIVSIYGLIHVMYISGSINPYGMLHVTYGNATGDYIKGIFMAPCYINTFVNCAFAFYFLYNKRYILSFMSVAIACFTTSNFASIMLVLLLLAAMVVLKNRKMRITLLAELAFLVCFYLFVSTNNVNYMMTSLFGKGDSTEMAALKKLQEEMSKRLQAALSVFENRELKSNYGKGISAELTYYYLESEPKRMLLGAGMGEFSSQLALRTSDINRHKKSRVFRMLPEYISPDFQQNHYQVFTVIYGLPEVYHSIRHLPNSFINQIFGEYGVLGFILFLVFYVWFFVKRVRKLKYSIFIGILMAYFLLFDYMFEYLSLVVFFEMFFLLELKQSEALKQAE
ncbi:MAG TPA: hypothetical protein VEB40_04405 [Flavipsychrobacter sp.]|nr:hypothetical protein [Flavipsychrobacter sp.]